MTATWLALHACLCTDVGVDPETLPTTCAGHRSDRVVPPVPESPGYEPMALGHRCAARQCPTAKPAPTTEDQADQAAERNEETHDE